MGLIKIIGKIWRRLIYNFFPTSQNSALTPSLLSQLEGYHDHEFLYGHVVTWCPVYDWQHGMDVYIRMNWEIKGIFLPPNEMNELNVM
jgi:hypothetical protein